MEEKKLNIEEVESDTMTSDSNQEAQTLMGLLAPYAADPKIIKAYRSIRSDIYGIGERRAVSKKEKQKKKAKRRMAKKSKH